MSCRQRTADVRGVALHAGLPVLARLGRQAEVDLLRRLLSTPAPGRPTLVSVEGARGFGKTWLLQEALAGPAPAASGVVLCTCRRLQQPVPYWPLQAAWRAGGALPPGPRPQDPAAAVEGWATRLAGQGTAAPALVVLDAAQWADPWTLRVLDAVVSGTFGPPPLLWVAWRPREGTTELALLLDEAEQNRGCLRLPLAPLGEQEVHEALAEHLVEGDARRLAAWLLAATAGLPDLLAATVEALAREAILIPSAPGWCLDQQRLEALDGAAGDLPGPALDILRRRYGALPGPARTIVDVTAVLGGRIDPVILEKTCGAAGDAAMEDLMAMGLMSLVDDEWGARYSFTVPALGSVVMTGLSVMRRERLRTLAEGA